VGLQVARWGVGLADYPMSSLAEVGYPMGLVEQVEQLDAGLAGCPMDSLAEQADYPKS